MIIVSVLIIFLASYIIRMYVSYRNASSFNQSPLDIHTFDGLDCPYHPSVLYFEKAWNGYHYWMAETPLSPHCKPYGDRNECPSLHVSNDGKNWIELSDGKPNPLVNFGAEGERQLNYYSDPHLVKVGDALECWYRLTERHGDLNDHSDVTLCKISTLDGRHWSEEVVISRLKENATRMGLGKMLISPALIYHPEKGYTMWYVDSSRHDAPRRVVVSSSSDGKTWCDYQPCSFHGRSVNVWHLDVQKIDGEGYYLTSYDWHSLTLWKSEDGFSFSFVRELLTPSVVGSFYGTGLYRSCLIKTGKGFNLYFSARDIPMHRTYIGLMEGNTPENLQVVSGSENEHFCSFVSHAHLRYMCDRDILIFHLHRLTPARIFKSIRRRWYAKSKSRIQHYDI